MLFKKQNNLKMLTFFACDVKFRFLKSHLVMSKIKIISIRCVIAQKNRIDLLITNLKGN